MRILKKSDLKIGERYFLTDYHNPNLKHQEDGIVIYSCVYDDYRKEQEKKYGFASLKEPALKVVKIEYIIGRNIKTKYFEYYMDANYLRNHNIYSDIGDAQQEAIHLLFEKWQPFSE